ncbi:methyltransferase domain-containing protein [Pannus brasiliensis CCIBt3594]|uniref:Methyltransferase domain-containing protein n=1 Tax=Pannus brasiliensis CCIBt3594 TaxID=1427578 RepID=A0AAW9R051_9CHRO
MLKRLLLIAALLILVLCFFGALNFTYDSPAVARGESYETRSIHSRDGIGKFYRGREIAKVMGHQEMLWLERSSREVTEKPNDVITALGLKSGDTVADIGAGTGYFSFRMASLVSRVFAVDIQPEMLEAIEFLKTENKIPNVKTILGTETDPDLPDGSIDLALMVDAYHEFAYPREMMENLVKALKPDGRVALVEYRRENPLVPIKALHKMTRKQVEKEMAAVGLNLQESIESLPQQHLLIFGKKRSSVS